MSDYPGVQLKTPASMALLMLSLARTSHCLTPDLMMRAGHLKVLAPLAFLKDPTG